MAKDPAFLFYPGDWLGGTMGMTFEDKGAYMELLMMQFTRGHMTDHMIGQTVGQLWVNIQDKFKKDDQGLWFNERLDVEKEKRKSYTDSRKNNIKGTNQHTKKDKKTHGHMTSHMENVNKDVIISIVSYLNIKAEKKFKTDSDKTIKTITARINEGYSENDFRKVIDTKCLKWKNDLKMSDYLRPETLFGTKFESYLNETASIKVDHSIPGMVY
ncbi:MAG: conserved phage C-terminal domain-containing protein [Pedobacter sp.]|jgi:uncharacterized phage protein (TIGR02220 family)